MPRRSRKPLTRTEKMLRSDGALCLTFVNTGTDKRGNLDTYSKLLAWGLEFGDLADADLRRLDDLAAEHPGKASAVVRRAQNLRQRLERVFLALAAGKKPAAADFDAFNAELRRAMAARELIATGSGWRWSWGESDDGDLDRVLWPVLLSAGDLLAVDDRRRMQVCQQDDCGLLFIAHGGGRPRKFCGATCRNRSSTRRHYHKTLKPERRRWRQEREREDRARTASYIVRRHSTAEND